MIKHMSKRTHCDGLWPSFGQSSMCGSLLINDIFPRDQSTRILISEPNLENCHYLKYVQIVNLGVASLLFPKRVTVGAGASAQYTMACTLDAYHPTTSPSNQPTTHTPTYSLHVGDDEINDKNVFQH